MTDILLTLLAKIFAIVTISLWGFVIWLIFILIGAWPYLDDRMQSMIKRELEDEFERAERVDIGWDSDHRTSWEKVRMLYRKEK